MHELSIAMSIVEMASEEARQHDGGIEAVHLRLGAWCGVAREALQFSWQAACAGTLLDGTRLVIEEVPLTVYCERCRQQQTLAAPRLLCPDCGAPAPTVVGGREMEVFALELAP